MAISVFYPLGRCFERREYNLSDGIWDLVKGIYIVYDGYKQIAEYVNSELHQQYAWDMAGLDNYISFTAAKPGSHPKGATILFGDGHATAENKNFWMNGDAVIEKLFNPALN